MTRSPTLRVVEREMRVYSKLWTGSVFSFFVVPVLFLAAIGNGLGGLVQQRTGGVDGLPYMQFVAPGLLAGMAMQLAVPNSLWPVMAGTKWLRFLYGVVATPITATEVYTGYVLWSVIRATITGAPFLLVAALFGGVPSPWGVLALPAAVLTGVAFAAPLIAFTATQDNDLSFPLILRLVVMPLFLFSGTFFPVSQLPHWLRWFPAASPLWHGVELCRAATTGRGDLGAELGHVAVLVAVITAGAVWGRRTFMRKLMP